MGSPNSERDVSLVKECLSGSEQAWNDLYCRYVALVGSVVRRRMGTSYTDVEDLTQNVFLSLISSLASYDPAYSLPRFICMVAERLCIQEYRQRKAAKRDAEIEPLDLHDGGEEGAKKAASELESQERRLEQSQLVDILRMGLRGLDSRCRELLTLRYYEELPFKEIAGMQGASENTVTVQTKRCLGELRGAYEREARKGGR
jgi:RNA polymerase sigma factor (sigma-70 family)